MKLSASQLATVAGFGLMGLVVVGLFSGSQASPKHPAPQVLGIAHSNSTPSSLSSSSINSSATIQSSSSAQSVVSVSSANLVKETVSAGITPVSISSSVGGYIPYYQAQKKEQSHAQAAQPVSGYISGSCKQLAKKGLGNFRPGDPNYTKDRDRDNDGVACEL